MKTKNCVIIDDDEFILYTLKEYAKFLKYNPLCYKAISGFIHDLSKNSLKDNIELLVTDKDVGDENGANLVKELRDKGYNFPIILITGDYTFDFIGIEKYRVSFLRKPFSFLDFKEKVKAAYKLVGKEYWFLI